MVLLGRSIPSSVKRLGETVSYLGLLAPWTAPSNGRFLIFAQGRSGTTLLVDLLNSHPEIHCDGEILSERVLMPRLYVERQNRRFRDSTYGFKVKIYQLTAEQRVSNVEQFLRRMQDDGWKIVYLWRRNLLRQAISGSVAYESGVFHRQRSTEVQVTPKLRVDCKVLIWAMEQRRKCLMQEASALREIPHLTLEYERDLQTQGVQQDSANRVFAFVGVSSAPVSTDLARTGSDRLADMVENYDELVESLRATEYAEFLD